MFRTYFRTIFGIGNIWIRYLDERQHVAFIVCTNTCFVAYMIFFLEDYYATATNIIDVKVCMSEYESE